MSSVEGLRQFVNERLTAASEEIFVVFRKTVVELEEEIDRQRRLLDIVLKPDVKLHWTELPLQHVYLEEEEEEEEEEEGLCVQVRISSLEPEPPHIEEEQGELCSSQEGEQLGLNQETDAFLLTPTNEESDHSEDQTMDLNAGNTLREPGNQAVFKMPVISCVVSVAQMDPLLLANNSDLAESQDHKEGIDGDSGLTRRTRPRRQRRHRKRACQSTNALTGQKSLTCDTCGKEFRCQSQFKRHLITHTGGKLGKFSCKTCGKGFSQNSQLTAHSRTHTGEKPLYLSCKTCGKDFRFDSDLKRHMISHTGEKPYPCKTCGQRFSYKSALKIHMEAHTTDEGPVAPARRKPRARRRTRPYRKCTLSST